MSWAALATGIYNIAASDTGSGGLLYSTSPLVSGFFVNMAPQGQAFPYVVCVLVSDTESKVYSTSSRAIEYGVQFSVWTDVADGLLPGQAIVNRLRTLYDRVSPTVSGFTASQFLRTGGAPPEPTDEYFHFIEEYQALLSS